MMSRDQSQLKSKSTRRVLERCKSRDTIEIIDVEENSGVEGKNDNVVIVDIDEASQQGPRGSGTMRRNSCPTGVISIDDEDGDIDDSLRNVHADLTSMEFRPASNNSPLSEESKSDVSPMTFKKRNPFYNAMGFMRKHHDVGPSSDCFGLGSSSECCSSESDSTDFNSSGSTSSDSDSSDCEIIEDSSGNIREQWERAALRKKMSNKDQISSDEQSSASSSSADAGLSFEEATHSNIDIENCINKVCSNQSEKIPSESCPNKSSQEKENPGVIGRTFWKINVDTTDLDLDVATSIGHKEPECTSKTCSQRVQATRENLSENMRDGFRSQKIVPDTSVCHLNMQHIPEINDEGEGDDDVDGDGGGGGGGNISSLDKEKQVPEVTASATDRHSAEFSFLGKVVSSPEQLSPCNPQTRDEKFSPESTIQGEKEHLPADSSLFVHPQCFPVASTETNVFQEKKKPSCDETPLCNFKHSDGPALNSETNIEEPLALKSNEESGKTGRIKFSETGPADTPQVHDSLICERERHKESDEYRRAVEEEWASRQRELQIQAEEAQRLKRKRKAEMLRLLDMEKRQKQRLEEIRESQKKDKETITLKELLRAEVRKELDLMEARYRDMTSLLRGLGIQVKGGPFPMPREVTAAYKQALLKFHPDRSSRSDIHQQVRAEEIFKLISRLKGKLMPW